MPPKLPLASSKCLSLFVANKCIVLILDPHGKLSERQRAARVAATGHFSAMLSSAIKKKQRFQRSAQSGMWNLRTEIANHARLNEQLLDLGFEVGDLWHRVSAGHLHAKQHLERMQRVGGVEHTWFLS